MAEKMINNVRPKEAETREEKLLLGFLDHQAKQIGFGQIEMEFTVRGGCITIIKSREVIRTFNVGQP